jgi:hypothetical protein
VICQHPLFFGEIYRHNERGEYGRAPVRWDGPRKKAHNDILRLLFVYQVTCVVILRAEHRNIGKSKKIHEDDVKKSK